MHSSTRIYQRNRVPDVSYETAQHIAKCPCGIDLDVYISRGELESTLKHYWKDGEIYHKCGTDKPCRLFWGRQI